MDTNNKINLDSILRNITNLLIIGFLGWLIYTMFIVPQTNPNQKYFEKEIVKLDSMNIKLNVKLDSLKLSEKKIILEKETIIKQEYHEKEIVKNYSDSASVDFFINYTNEYIRTNK